MKVYLLKGLFLPMFISVSVLFLPFLVVFLISFFVDFHTTILIAFIVMFIVYIGITIICYRYSLSPKNYMLLKDDSIYFHYVKEKNYNVIDKDIKVKDILQIEYYKISSIIGWLLMFTQCFAVRSASILENTPELNENQWSYIGYFSTKQIKFISQMYGIPLVVHGFFGKRKYNFE